MISSRQSTLSACGPKTRLARITVACLLALLVGNLFRAAAEEPDAAESSVARIESVVSLLELVIDTEGDPARQCLELLARKIQSGEIDRLLRDVCRDQLAGH